MTEPRQPEIRVIRNLEEFFDEQEEATAMANELLAPEQLDVTWGSYWIRFYDIEARVIIFGYVQTVEEAEAAELASGGSKEELAYTTPRLREMHDNGYMWGWCHSIIASEPGSTHRSRLWPIGGDTYLAAEQMGWDIDRLDREYKTKIEAAYQGIRAHTMRMLGR